jgi:hypothetical protein
MNKYESLNENWFYTQLLNIIYEKVGIDKFDIIDNNENLIVFRFNFPKSYNFEIVFWLNESRISFNIADWYEIIDSYIINDKDSHEVYDFIDTIFKNKVLIEKYCTEKSNRIYKKNLVYSERINDKIQEVVNVKKMFFKLPWIKEKLIIINEFKPLY